MGVRTSFFKPTPIIYLVFEKNDLFIYLIKQNVYIFIYCSLIFYTLFAVCKQFTNKYFNFGFWAEYLSKIMSIFKQGCQKMGSFIYQWWKTGSVIYFSLEKAGLSYTWQRWKRGLFGRHIHITMSYIGSSPQKKSLYSHS